LVFLDETATTIAMTPRYARAPRGQRVRGTVPRNHGQNTTLLAALTATGTGPTLALDGAVDGAAFAAYLREVLAPTLRPGQVVVLDNLSAHRGDAARAIVEARGCRLLFLPAYSPDFSPIELAFAKLKEALRRAGARTKDALLDALASALDTITAQDARGWFAACGFPLPEAQPQHEPL
jgi:transposase